MLTRKIGVALLSGLMIAGLAGCSPKVSTTDSADQKIDISSFRLLLNRSVYSYKGKAVTPAVKVLSEDNEALSAKDYSISYSNNKKIGTATVKVKGVKTYEGALTKKFTIVKDASKLDQTALSNVLDDISSFDSGDSGTSIKVTVAAVNLIDYAQSVNLAKVKKSDLNRYVRKWHQSLSKDEKAAVQDNVETIEDTADGILADMKGYRDDLDDAGVREQAKRAVKAKHAKKDWKKLKEVLNQYD